jgi:hypothetical protein
LRQKTTEGFLRIGLVGGAVLIVASASAAKPMMFWNLTAATITHLYLAPAGTTTWTQDECLNDPDKSVDPDERLRLSGVTAGRYDVRLTDTHGRTCLLRNVEVRGDRPYAFTISEDQMKRCGN